MPPARASRSHAASARRGARSRPTSRPVSSRAGWSGCRRSTTRSRPSAGRIGRAYRALNEEYGEDRTEFAGRWREYVGTLNFAELNELIEQHNEWYPIERELPMDPRTRDYVKLGGRDYRRPILGPAWVLAQFPAG